MEPVKTNSGEFQDPFGNVSSTRKTTKQIVRFTMVFIFFYSFFIVLNHFFGKQGFALSTEFLFFYFGTIVTLFTAAFTPKAFAQSKEWAAFAQVMSKNKPDGNTE